MILTVIYGGEPEAPAPPPQGHRVHLADPDFVIPVRSSDGRTIYEVRQLPDGRWYCPCKDFEYRGHERPCRHINEAQRKVG